VECRLTASENKDFFIIIKFIFVEKFKVSVLDPHGSGIICIAESGSRSRKANKTHKNRKSKEISCFEVLDVLF
jgi:hypothetical protein